MMTQEELLTAMDLNEEEMTFKMTRLEALDLCLGCVSYATSAYLEGDEGTRKKWMKLHDLLREQFDEQDPALLEKHGLA